MKKQYKPIRNIAAQNIGIVYNPLSFIDKDKYIVFMDYDLFSKNVSKELFNEIFRYICVGVMFETRDCDLMRHVLRKKCFKDKLNGKTI